MKLSYSLLRRVHTILMSVFYHLGFVPFNLALRRIDISVTDAIWPGVGTAVITTIGILWFKEPANAVKLIYRHLEKELDIDSTPKRVERFILKQVYQTSKRSVP